jgi:phospholipid transport system substrate-binding protein
MTMIGLPILVAVSPVPIRRVWAQAGDEAVSFIKSTSDQLVAITNAAGMPAEKHRRLKDVLEATVDVEDVARFCLGRFWRIATAEQQAQYLVLFDELLVTEIGGHLGDYQGVQVTMGLARTSADTEIVITTVTRPNSPATQVEWVVSKSSGRAKIVDLLAGGTSMRLTQSADFAAYLARHQYNIHELLEGMRQQLAQAN